MSDQDALVVLEEAGLPRDYKIHLHCFNSDWEMCQVWMQRFSKLKVGFTPLITYANDELHHVVRNIPLNRILLETDSPYFLPRLTSSQLGFSHPGLVIHTAAQIALLKNVSIEEVVKANELNVMETFGF